MARPATACAGASAGIAAVKARKNAFEVMLMVNVKRKKVLVKLISSD